jgi:predicted nucleotidyltransferase
MERERVLLLLRSSLPKLRALGVKSVAVFGSTARDEAGTQSDVDVLIEFSERATFDKYMEVKFLLESSLGKPVDLVTRGALKRRMRPQVEQEAIYVS